jgi:hypothetical protein
MARNTKGLPLAAHNVIASDQHHAPVFFFESILICFKQLER